MLLSLALHLALIMLIQPAPRSTPREVMLQARLVAPKPAVARPAPMPKLKTDLTDAHSAVVPMHPDAPSTPLPAEEAAASPKPETDAGAEKPEADDDAAAPEPREQVALGSGQASALPEIPVMLDTRWYTARQVDRRPELMTPALPVYPEQARSRGIEGSVVVEVHIDETGRVRDIQILEADPPGVFDAAVLEVYGQALYRPALLDGRPVRYIGKYRVLFELD
ncbi:MAG: TonB family protein [Thiobacillaceae bacterium]